MAMPKAAASHSMRILTTCLCSVAFLLAGCGKRLSGRYESTSVGPMLLPVMSSQPQTNTAQPMPATPGMNKLTLEFYDTFKKGTFTR